MREERGAEILLVPEISSSTKLQNANTRKQAEQIKAQRILDIQQHGIVNLEDVKKTLGSTTCRIFVNRLAATLAITTGAELYSFSKILGHGSIVSTQVYASVNMEKKEEAVNLTDGIFG